MEEFKKMSEETAQELLSAIEEFNKSMDDFQTAFKAKMDVYLTECQREITRKFVDYMHKYACASFLTRWYWLRKARKCNDALKGIIQLYTELCQQKI